MPLFLFHGENTFLIHRKINHWCQEFTKKHGGDINISILEGEKTSSSEILNNCTSMPFLSEKRLVIVKNFLKFTKTEEQKKLAEKLDELPDFTVLVFTENEITDKRLSLYKKITKIGKVEEFAPLAGLKLNTWIMEQARKKSGKISPRTADYLAAISGNNLWQLEQEITKLSLYAKNREIINRDIDELTTANLTSSIFKLTDFLGQKQTPSALKTLHTLIDSGEDLMMIFHMIIRHFRILIQIRDLNDQKKNQKEIIQILKQHPFVIMKGVQQSKNFYLEKLKKIYQNLLDIEIGLKSGKIKISADDNREFILALDRFIIDCTT